MSSSKDGVTPSKVRKETEVQEVCARILDLKQGEEITQQVLDSSPTFHLRWAADETRPPAVIGTHWIDHLDAGGCIAKCKPHDFKFEDEWLPLYTRAGVTRHVSSLSSGMAGHMLAFYGKKTNPRAGLLHGQAVAASKAIANIPTWMGYFTRWRV